MYSYCKPEEMLQHAHGIVLKVTQTAVTCEIPRLNHNVDHSLLDADDYLYGSKLVQTCEPGYEPEDTEDRKQLQCNLFGKWDGDILSCQPVKCEPPTLSEHVTTPFSRPSQNIYKSTVVQRCVTGYRPVADSGNAELICGADKEWRGDVLQCEPVECGPPNLNEHVRIEDASFTYKNTVHQECDPGYKPTSGATYDEFPLTCGADTEWTGETLECQPISCGPKPAFSNGYYKGGDIYRETTTPVCNPSASTRTQIVKTGGADKLTCDQNGNWVGDVAVCSEMCLINYFHQQMTRNGHSLHGAYKEKYALGEAVTYSCTPGHHGSLLYGCGGEGNGWRQTGGSCDPVECGPPNLHEHVRIEDASFTYKNTVHQECDPGYKPTSGSTDNEFPLTCGADTEWTGEKLQCQPVECGPPNLHEHVRIEDASFTYKNTVHQECDPGYEPTSGAIDDEFPLTCGADTEWAGAKLQCEPISCGPKPAFPNGYYEGGDIYRETTKPVCNPSASTKTQFVKTGGADKLTCDQNGNWVGDVAVCSEMCLLDYFHQQMTRNRHSLQSAYKEKYALGEAVTYSCTPGHHGSLLYGCAGEGNGWRQTGGSCRRSCFPADSTVTYTDGSIKPLSAVKIGDEVMAVNPDSLERVSSKVTGFAYRDVNEKHNFITIKLENGQVLTVTDFHYTFVKTSDGAQKVIARDVKVGDVMYVTSTGNDSHTSHVVDIGRVDAYGVIAPITEAGTVIVDGVYMSCFCQD